MVSTEESNWFSKHYSVSTSILRGQKQRKKKGARHSSLMNWQVSVGALCFTPVFGEFPVKSFMTQNNLLVKASPFDIRNIWTVGKAPLVEGKKARSSSTCLQWTVLIYLNSVLTRSWWKLKEKRAKHIPWEFKNILSLGVYPPFVFTRASTVVTLNSMVVNEKDMRNYLLEWPRATVSYFSEQMRELEPMKQTCWVKHPSSLCWNLIKGFQAKNFSLPFPAVLANPLTDMVPSYTHWASLLSIDDPSFNNSVLKYSVKIHSRNNIFCAYVFRTRNSTNWWQQRNSAALLLGSRVQTASHSVR